MFFSLLVFFRILLCLERSSFFMVWLSLELNLIGFIILMVSSVEQPIFPRIKYFIIQRLGSAMFLFFRIWFSLLRRITRRVLLVLALLWKLGAAPFQGWMVMLREDLKWEIFFVIRTIQKIIPLFILIERLFWNLKPVVLLGAVVRVVGGLFRNNFKKILVYSSVLRLAWILRSLRLYEGMLYLVVYRLRFFLISSLSLSLVLHQQSALPHLNFRRSETLILLILLLSFIGMPPFVGFYPKLLLLTALVSAQETLLFSCLLARSAFFVLIYIRLCLIRIELRQPQLEGRWLAEKLNILYSLPLILGLLAFIRLCVLLNFDFNVDEETRHT